MSEIHILCVYNIVKKKEKEKFEPIKLYTKTRENSI